MTKCTRVFDIIKKKRAKKYLVYPYTSNYWSFYNQEQKGDISHNLTDKNFTFLQNKRRHFIQYLICEYEHDSTNQI